MKKLNSPFRRTMNVGNYNQAEADFNYNSLNDHVEFSNHMAREKSKRMNKWSKHDGRSEEKAITTTWKYAPTDK